MFVTRNAVNLVASHRQTQAIVLSVCMIVRDNADILREALESIRPWVDEMVIVDTGSKDETPKIAERFGARVFHFPWCDDFSAARNESLRHARGAWLFWMDSDDTIDPENGQELRELAYGEHSSQTLGYVMQVHCPSRDGDTADGVTAVDHVKMFRRHPSLRFEFRIHEQILPSIRRMGGDVAWTDIHVTHSGADQSAEGRQHKYVRDLRILELEAEERPDHPFVLFNLGMTYADMQRYDMAMPNLRRCLEVSDPAESHVRKAHALLVSTLQADGDMDEAIRVCREARQTFPDDPELLFREGMLAHVTGREQEAEQAYRSVLAGRGSRHFSSIDPGILGYKTRHNLALVYQDMGRDDLAELQWRHALKEVPTFREARRSLGECLLRQQRIVAAELQVEDMLTEPTLQSDAHLLRALLMAANGEYEAARLELAATVRRFPTEVEPLQALCKLLFEQGEPAEAESMLLRLLELQPCDAAAHHNLGMVYLRLRKYGDAAGCFRESLRLRPMSVATRDGLAEALERSSRGGPTTSLT